MIVNSSYNKLATFYIKKSAGPEMSRRFEQKIPAFIQVHISRGASNKCTLAGGDFLGAQKRLRRSPCNSLHSVALTFYLSESFSARELIDVARGSMINLIKQGQSTLAE
jgi:hypothetical protein